MTLKVTPDGKLFQAPRRKRRVPCPHAEPEAHSAWAQAKTRELFPELFPTPALIKVRRRQLHDEPFDLYCEAFTRHAEGFTTLPLHELEAIADAARSIIRQRTGR